MLLLYAIVAGLLIGLLAGGRPGALAGVRFRWWPVAFAGLLFQLLLFSPPVASVVGDAGPPLYVGSTMLVLLALGFNLRRPGFALIGLGALLNMIAVVANGGQMPASPEAFLALNGVAQVPVEHFSNSRLIGPETAFAYLGDIFHLPRPLPLANIFSIGDVLIGLGGALFIVRTMAAGRPATNAARERTGAGLDARAALPHSG